MTMATEAVETVKKILFLNIGAVLHRCMLHKPGKVIALLRLPLKKCTNDNL